MPRTRAASRPANSAEPNVVTTSHRAGPCQPLPGIFTVGRVPLHAGQSQRAAPSPSGAATPPTSVDRSPCTRQTTPSGSNQPGPVPTRAMSRTQFGAPVGSPETRARRSPGPDRSAGRGGGHGAILAGSAGTGRSSSGPPPTAAGPPRSRTRHHEPGLRGRYDDSSVLPSRNPARSSVRGPDTLPVHTAGAGCLTALVLHRGASRAPVSAYQAASRANPSSRLDLRSPTQHRAGAPLVEPVRRAQLLGQEPGERRGRRAGRAAPRPAPRRRRPARPAGRAPARCGPRHAGRARTAGRAPRPTGRGSPFETTSASPCTGPPASTAATSASTRRCRRRSCRSARHRSRSAAAGRPRPAATIRATSWLSPGPHTRCGRTASTASAGESAASASRSATAFDRE